MTSRGPVVLDALVLRAHPTGVGRSVLELIRAMAATDRGLDFVVLTTAPRMFDFLSGSRRWQVRECPGARGSLLQKALYTQWQVPRICRQLGAGMLHSMQFIAPLRVSCPSMLTVHDLTWHHYPETIEQPRLAYYQFLAPRALAGVDRILANSAATGIELAEAYPASAGKISVTRFATPSWVWSAEEQAPDKNSPTGSRPYFLFVSTLEPRKNLKRLLAAYEMFLAAAEQDGRLAAEIPDLHLVGPMGWKESSLQGTLNRLQATGRVHLLDYRYGNDLWTRYRRARALLFPSLHEGFGFPTLEAMAAGLPVMTSNRGAMAEVGGDCVLLVDPENPAEMADRMATLAWDQTVIEDLRTRGLARARNWTWQRTADDTCAAYHALLAAAENSPES